MNQETGQINPEAFNGVPYPMYDQIEPVRAAKIVSISNNDNLTATLALEGFDAITVSADFMEHHIVEADDYFIVYEDGTENAVLPSVFVRDYKPRKQANAEIEADPATVSPELSELKSAATGLIGRLESYFSVEMPEHFHVALADLRARL